MFYRNYGKRLLDIFLSAGGLALLSPLLLLTAIAVKCGPRGPVFFGQQRVGRNGKTFIIRKFRTMVVNAESLGPNITSAGDPRVTSIGRFLRRWKLDEFPQLWNVLTGDMSLVGPRPELPSYVSNYTPEQRHVLSVRPGITDLAAIAYRHEEQVLAAADDPGQYYKEVVLPHKLSLNLTYIEKLSLPLDIKLILQTLKVISPAGAPHPIPVPSQNPASGGQESRSSTPPASPKPSLKR